jgi:hypothetical protein
MLLRIKDRTVTRTDKTSWLTTKFLLFLSEKTGKRESFMIRLSINYAEEVRFSLANLKKTEDWPCGMKNSRLLFLPSLLGWLSKLILNFDNNV